MLFNLKVIIFNKVKKFHVNFVDSVMQPDYYDYKKIYKFCEKKKMERE